MKKNRSARVRLAPPVRSEAWPQSNCSLLVLASLGLLSFALPHDALAQRVIAPATLPVLRGVASGQAVVNGSVPGAARPVMTIDQATQRAIIDWRSFDIGSSAEVLFRHQMGATASTLNRIYDANPSVIQGRLRSSGATEGSAGGQIILINQNGILFNRGAQVNTQSLVASSLNLSNQRFLSGALTGGGNTAPAFEGGYALDGDGSTVIAPPGGPRLGSIVIGGSGDAGAAAPSLTANAGGSIMIFAPSIDNQGGIIRAPDGQVILAAGSKAYLSINPSETDITLRGYVVEVEAAADGAGLNLTSLIRNAGDISADRGNVTLAALAVNQEGRISAKTALQANGSIYLTAHTKDKAQSGTVSFKTSSVTEVTPDAADTSTAPDSQSYEASRGVIEVSGRTIENHGSVRVPGGVIKLNASALVEAESARVYLASGSETSVAGAWADVDFGKNLQTFRVTSNELKNSPNQKTGLLRGAMVTVDLRQDNAILDLTGYRGIVGRTVAEKAAAGGELQITSTGSVVQRSGAVIDASGGGYRYNGGMVNTSRLLGDDGKIYDIATAPEQRRYTQQLDNYQRVDARWGQTTNIANPLGTVGTYQAAHTEGKAGGLVSISSMAGVVLDGTLKGGVTVGSRQMANAPRGATLRVGSAEAGTNKLPENQRIGSITWQQQAADSLGAGFNANSLLTDAQRDAFTLGASQVFGSATQTANGLVETGFGTVELNSNGRIVVPSDVAITTGAGASLVLRAKQIDIAGDIRLPGGNLTITPVSSDSASTVPALEPLGGERVIVREGATLSTAGAWINNANVDGSFVGAPAPSGRRNADGSTTRAIDGGNISIAVTHPLDQVRLEHGALLDVGGGASIASNQRVTGGNGGKLSIANGADGQTNPNWLGAELRGLAVGTGGELSLKMGRAVIDADGATGVVPEATTRLGAGLFADQGFSKVSVEAANGIDIVAGTALKVEQKNLLIDPSTARLLATGGDLATIASVQRLPDSRRSAASVVLNAKGGGAVLGSGVLTLNEGASITTDPQGEITLSGTDGLNIHGRLSAPGGKIGLTLNGPAALTASDLHIGATADISTAGVFVQTPNERGLVQGSLHNGGAITLESKGAGLQIDAGARIDVSGVNQTVDQASNGRTPVFTQQTLDGHAGSLVIKSQGRTVLDGNMLGHGGSANAAGGSFALELRQPDGQASLPDERRIVITPNGTPAVAQPGMVDAQVNVLALTEGGFEKLRLQSENRIEFQGSSTLAFERGVRLDAPLIDLADGARVTLQGSTVALGQSLGARQAVTVNEVISQDLVDGSPSLPVTTRAGTGVLSVDAGAVDLHGDLTVNGTSLTRIASDSDIRLVGRSITFASDTGGQSVSRQMGSLTSAGNIELVAAQVYPTTRTDYTFSVKDTTSGSLVDGGRISVSSNGNAPGSVYSAGGKLTLEAQTIRQAGVIKAPQGEIDLHAGSSLELAPGSLTSVSAEGLTVLYGSTNAGTVWQYKDGTVTALSPVSAVSDEGKHITLSAPNVAVEEGATVDMRGGGGVLAVEFVPGNGGDHDITTAANTYAIIPAAQLAAMPYDLDTLSVKDPGFGFAVGNGRDAALYDSIRIGAGGAVPAGEYVLLPARYALLPDAYLVELQTGAAYRNLQQNTALINGATVLVGHRSARGTSVQESQSVGVVLRPGAAAVRRASDYNLTGAGFFADTAALERKAAPPSPWDAGRLLIVNASTLALGGNFETEAAASPSQTSGRMAEIDISASRIAVVDVAGSSAVPADFLQIEGGALSGLQGSVLLGGKRSNTDTGIRITTSAADSQVIVANSSAGAVNLPELVLAAGGSIDIRSGSVLAATGTARGTAPEVISTEQSGALVRLSSNAQTRLDRGTANAGSGDVRIAAGASVSASKSLLVDATRSTESQGQLRAGGEQGAGGSLSLSSVQVSLGDTAQAGALLSGLVISNAELAAYTGLDELVLRGYGGIDLIGNATLGSPSLKSLTLDTPVLRGRAGADGQAAQARITAGQLELANNSGVNSAAATGGGSLEMSAERLVLGGGAKAVDGFATVRLSATQTLMSEGEGALNAAAALTLQAPRVLAAGGSNQSVNAVDTSQAGAPVYSSLTLAAGAAPAAPAPAGETELGGRLALHGSGVTVATTVQARSGQIGITAHGAEGVSLASGAVLDARGQAKDFNGTVVTADGGAVSLTAASGRVALNAGAKLDVSAAEQGGAAGRVALRGDSLLFEGELAGRAAAGARSGSAAFDVGSLASTGFSALNSSLNAGGFAEERQLRLREGDITVVAADQVAARRVTLTADAGRIDVHGTVGTGAAKGGAQVNLFADTGLTLHDGSRLLAAGSNAGARGGEVRVATRSGTLAFEAGAEIDVRAGEAGPAGALTFGVSRDVNNVMNATQLVGTVRRGSGSNQASVDVEATRSYTVAGSVSSTEIDDYADHHNTFATRTDLATVTAGLRDETGAPLANARVLGATELRSTGDLELNNAWNLTSANWLAHGKPGTLTVRAAGNLTLSQSLGSPDNNILAGDTWNLRLVAGADLASANPLAVRATSQLPDSSGSLLLTGANAKLRTGTGRIDLAAARDVRIDNVAATVYTAGRIGEADTEANGNNRWGVDGGSITVLAGGDVAGAYGESGDLWINEWLRRPRTSLTDLRRDQKTDWWAHRSSFRQGIGTLAGGDIEVAAGQKITDLDVMLPTTGRTYRDANGARQVDVQGGGNLDVRAGADIVGSSFLVARGVGRVEAAGDVGAERRTQLYVMGASSGAVAGGAGIDLVAGGDVALQSVFNPTAMNMPNGTGTGPSFVRNSAKSTFFTYAPTSRAGVYAKSGNLSYEFGGIGGLWGANTADLIAYKGALPPNLSFVAFDGDINGPSTPDAITTFPSISANVAFLAGRSLNNVGFHASDLSPELAFTWQNFVERTGTAAGDSIQASGNAARIVEREFVGPYAFEMQALTGSFFGSSNNTVALTGPSRIRAGGDLLNLTAKLQNLLPDDVTELRADSGDIRGDGGLEIRGPGRLLMQAGRNIDLGKALVAGGGTSGGLGGLVATGNNANSQLLHPESARITLVAGVNGNVDLSRMDGAYAEVIALNKASADIIDLYRQLGTETNRDRVLAAESVAALAQNDATYARFVSLDQKAPRALAAYKEALRANSLPLGPTADSTAAATLYRLLNSEADVAKLQAAGSLAALAAAPGGSAYGGYVGLEQRYPRLFADYLLRRGEGALPTGVTPIVFSNALASAMATVVRPEDVTGGSIFSYQTSIQTYGGSNIDLWAPGGNVVVGLTTPPGETTIGVLTNAGGAIRSVLSGDFNINQGKVLTAQGGDIMLFSSQGSIDAGRGAKTSLTTAAPVRTVVTDEAGNQTVRVSIPNSAAGSGIQTLTSDPDGLGPLASPAAGDVFLFAPAGAIDAGEAGIRSSGNIVLNAQTVLNASNISSSGSSQGVPVAVTGSLASSLASSGSTSDGGAKAAQDAAKNASDAARAATASGVQKPNILTVEVLGFGDKNCKEQEKDCFAK